MKGDGYADIGSTVAGSPEPRPKDGTSHGYAHGEGKEEQEASEALAGHEEWGKEEKE